MPDKPQPPWFGYDSAENTRLDELRRQGRRMGENPTEYDTSQSVVPHLQEYDQTWNPTGNPTQRGQAAYDYQHKEDYLGRTGADGSSVEAIYTRMMGQKTGPVHDLANYWSTIASSLHEVVMEVNRRGTQAQGFWKSPGAEVFMAMGPGAAMKSASDWYQAAFLTANILAQLTVDMQREQGRITALLNEFDAEAKGLEDAVKARNKIENLEDLEGKPQQADYIRKLAAMTEKYTYQAQVIERAMGDAYWDAYNAMAGTTPGIYEGPTNAVVAPLYKFKDIGNQPGTPSVGSLPMTPGTPGAPPPGAGKPTPPPPAKPFTPGVGPGKPADVGNPAPPPPPTTPIGPVPPAPPPVVTPPAPPAPPVTIVPPTLTPTVTPPIPPVVTPPAAKVLPPKLPTPPVAPPVAPPGALPPALAKGVLKPGVPNQPNLPTMPGRGALRRPNQPVLGGARPNQPNLPSMPGGQRRQPNQPGLPGAPGGRRTNQPGLPSMPGAQRRPNAPGGSAQRPGTPGLPASPFAGRRAPATPSVLNGRTQQPGVPGGRPGSGTLPPGATRPVLDRPQPGRPGTPGQPGSRTPGGARRLPGGLSDPLRLTSLTRPSNPVLNRPLAGKAPFSAVGVPDALRGASRDPGATNQDERPLVRADLVARVHGVEPVPTAETPLDVQPVRDEDVFAPETPGGGVLATGTNEKGYRPEERAALPGAG
ncbi:hypothetical protein [Cryptosporangium japonicum]|uniref:Uncharacterized protein n=1 Tax=Cryptosporangium japonicum TaxID=80872 RepID=A0ABP3EZN6_9ACTN